jgi:ribosomal-protein-alanine N-acetyltransferase
MTPEALARLHGEAFSPDRGWTAVEFSELLTQPTVQIFERPQAFALVRSVADEAELLTLAVAPAARRGGLADALMRDWMSKVRATSAFLEVAADNHAAQALYEKHGFAVCGRRRAYYARPDSAAVDALLMRAALTFGQTR